MNNKFVIIGLVQSRVTSDILGNVANTESMVRKAAKKGAQIICLQELFNIPYIPQTQGVKKDDYAETIPGPTSLAMQKLAKELGIVLIVPIFEKAKNGKYYNTAIVFNQEGKLLGRYHKVHIPHDPGFYEKDYFQEGQEGYKNFKTKYGTFAVLICYDQWFPEAARQARLAGAEIIFYPTAIANIIGYKPPEGDWHDAWETVMRGHSIANSVAVAAVNRVGQEKKSVFWGQSFVTDAFGKILKRASSTKEEILIAKLDLNMSKFVSDGWGFMRNRRPDTYYSLIGRKLVEKSKRLKNIGGYKDTKKALGQL
jgi:agmatine deiminase